MAFDMQYYIITINNSISNSAPGDGFVDPQRIESYYSGTPYAFEGTPSGLTVGLCQAKRRGNFRYIEVLNQLQRIANVYIDSRSISTPGGSAPGWTPTSLTFTMLSQMDDSAWVTADESNPGATLTGTLCIQRCIARGLIADGFRQTEIFDPTSVAGIFGSTSSAPRYGSRIGNASSFEIGPYANSLAAATAAITVTKRVL